MSNEAKTGVATTGKGSSLQKISPMHAMSPFEEMERMMESDKVELIHTRHFRNQGVEHNFQHLEH